MFLEFLVDLDFFFCFGFCWLGWWDCFWMGRLLFELLFGFEEINLEVEIFFLFLLEFLVFWDVICDCDILDIDMNDLFFFELELDFDLDLWMLV